MVVREHTALSVSNFMPSSSASTPCNHLYPATCRASRLPATIFCTVRASEYVSVCTTWLLRTDVAEAIKLSSPLCPSSRYCTVRALPSHWRKYRNGWPVRFWIENPTCMYENACHSTVEHAFRYWTQYASLGCSVNKKCPKCDKHYWFPPSNLSSFSLSQCLNCTFALSGRGGDRTCFISTYRSELAPPFSLLKKSGISSERMMSNFYEVENR